MIMHPCLITDFYKVNHYEQYPIGTELVFSNLTARKPISSDYSYVMLFGLRYFIQEYLISQFVKFFHPLRAEKEYNQKEYINFIKESLGITNKDFSHIAELANLGYLPIEIRALPECVEIPFGVPALVIYNTHPKFYWVTNLLETIMSATLWQPSTSATIASMYRTRLNMYAEISGNPSFVPYQAHDFSFRGMSSFESAMLSGAAHLQFFNGSDSIPSIFFSHHFYNKPLSCGTSIPATEHSVMCAGGATLEQETETYRRLLQDVYPTGLLSIVSDTWDFWNVVTNILPSLKEVIMAREGKLVIRPDSGDPVKIICGDDLAEGPAQKGLIRCLDEIFGHTINSKGYKELDCHIGAIYGDSITLDRADKICSKLINMGYASTNLVFGVGSYTYQYNTRDTLGWAVKATYCEISGKGQAIHKDPKTDNGTKKSHSGILKVIKEDSGKYTVKQNCIWEEFYQDDNELKLIFRDGKLYE
jgi:nicotinamide phosphoribosyltransferase